MMEAKKVFSKDKFHPRNMLFFPNFHDA